MEKSTLTKLILKLLTENKAPLSFKEILNDLGIALNTNDYKKLKITLEEMCSSGLVETLSRRKYTIKTEEYGVFTGTLKIKHETGTVITNSPEFPKIYIKRRHIHNALDGDIVVVKLLGMKKEKRVKGEIVEILKRSDKRIVGTIEYDGNFYFLIPDDDKYLVDFLIHPQKLKGATHKDKVTAKFLSWDNPSKSPQAEVIEIIGKSGLPKVEYQAILNEFGISDQFNKHLLEEAETIPKAVTQKEIKERLDLRNEIIITIDPVDAKDFDDALSLKELENGNILLGVHIADVSYYINENSLINKEAYKRGNSIYLVDKAVPMLPEILSNEICSLKPNRIRLTFSVLMEFSPTGILKNYKIEESVIKSKKRFNYDEVLNIIETGKGEYSDLILRLHILAQLLRKRRFNKGGIDLESIEVKFQLDKDKNPIRAILKTSNYATQLVEECMLSANQTIAKHITKLSKEYGIKTKLPFLYRVHDEPNPTKLPEVLNYLGLFGVKSIQNIHSSKELNNFIKLFENKKEKPIAHQLLLRAMSRAEYSLENIGHYGLGFTEYTHFTSPIRRFPDLIVHRLIKEYSKGKPHNVRIKQLEQYLKEAGKQCSSTERLALEAERASIKLTHSVLAQKQIGKSFYGTISGVTHFGLFVFLDDIYAEGLLHIRDLLDDFYIFDEKNFRLIGRKKRKVFAFGKRIHVKIIRVNIEKREIDLGYID